MYPPLGPNQTWDGIPAPGQPSDHGGEGHGAFLGGDGWDMGHYPIMTYAVQGFETLDIYPYTARDGQYRGWNIIGRLDNGNLVCYAHLDACPGWGRYEEGEPIMIVGRYLNNTHLHFEEEGVLAGDMPARYGAVQPPIGEEDSVYYPFVQNAQPEKPCSTTMVVPWIDQTEDFTRIVKASFAVVNAASSNAKPIDVTVSIFDNTLAGGSMKVIGTMKNVKPGQSAALGIDPKYGFVGGGLYMTPSDGSITATLQQTLVLKAS